MPKVKMMASIAYPQSRLTARGLHPHSERSPQQGGAFFCL